MQDGQMRLLRETRRVGDPREMLVKIDMANVLIEAGYPIDVVAATLAFPTQGNVSRVQRLREAMDIARAWPTDLLYTAQRTKAPWHSLREPARWWREGKVEREDVVKFVTEYLSRKGAWPRVDDLRRAFGFAPTTRTDSEDPVPGQEGLLGPTLDPEHPHQGASDQAVRAGREPCSGRG